METEVRQIIRRILAGKDQPTPLDLRVFVAMLHEESVTYEDFEAVGGAELSDAVSDAWDNWNMENRDE